MCQTARQQDCLATTQILNKLLQRHLAATEPDNTADSDRTADLDGTADPDGTTDRDGAGDPDITATWSHSDEISRKSQSPGDVGNDQFQTVVEDGPRDPAVCALITDTTQCLLAMLQDGKL